MSFSLIVFSAKQNCADNLARLSTDNPQFVVSGYNVNAWQFNFIVQAFGSSFTLFIPECIQSEVLGILRVAIPQKHPSASITHLRSIGDWEKYVVYNLHVSELEELLRCSNSLYFDLRITWVEC